MRFPLHNKLIDHKGTVIFSSVVIIINIYYTISNGRRNIIELACWQAVSNGKETRSRVIGRLDVKH
jgi:hypothetical protein